MAQPGRYTLLFLNIGTSSSPIWEAVAKQTGLDITRGRNTQSISHKDSTAEVTIAGTKTISWSLTGVMFRSAETMKLMRDHYENATDVQVRVGEFGNYIEEMTGKVNSFNESHPVDGVSTYTMELAPVDAPTRL